MRTKITNLLTLAAMIFTVGTLFAAEAAAEVRFHASVRTPAVTIHVGSTPAEYPDFRCVRPLSPRGHVYNTVKHDVKIAQRLYWYTGVPVGELLKYRRYGYDWYEIGQWLHVPGQILRAAMSEPGWNRFLHEGGFHKGNHGKNKHGGNYHTMNEYGR